MASIILILLTSVMAISHAASDCPVFPEPPHEVTVQDRRQDLEEAARTTALHIARSDLTAPGQLEALRISTFATLEKMAPPTTEELRESAQRARMSVEELSRVSKEIGTEISVVEVELTRITQGFAVPTSIRNLPVVGAVSAKGAALVSKLLPHEWLVKINRHTDIHAILETAESRINNQIEDLKSRADASETESRLLEAKLGPCRDRLIFYEALITHLEDFAETLSHQQRSNLEVGLLGEIRKEQISLNRLIAATHQLLTKKELIRSALRMNAREGQRVRDSLIEHMKGEMVLVDDMAAGTLLLTHLDRMKNAARELRLLSSRTMKAYTTKLSQMADQPVIDASQLRTDQTEIAKVAKALVSRRQESLRTLDSQLRESEELAEQARKEQHRVEDLNRGRNSVGEPE